MQVFEGFSWKQIKDVKAGDGEPPCGELPMLRGRKRM